MSENTLFPGRPNYTGPTKGIFGLLHHQVLAEDSHDVMERVAYIKKHKPEHEIAIRLHNMIYLGGCQAAVDYKAKYDAFDAKYRPEYDALYADYDAKLTALNADYEAKLTAYYRAKRDALYADYKAKRDALDADYEAKYAPFYADILTYIRSHIPDCAWNGKTMVFDGSAAQ